MSMAYDSSAAEGLSIHRWRDGVKKYVIGRYPLVQIVEPHIVAQ